MDNIVFILLGIALVAILIYLSLQNYFEGQTSFNYNTNMLQVSQIDLTDVRDPNSSNFSYGMWMNIHKWENDGDKSIYDRPTEMKVFIRNGTLMVSIYTSSIDENDVVTSVTNDFELIRNLPLHKWMYINISVSKNKNDRSIIDAYIDGKLIKSLEYDGVIVPSNNKADIGPLDANLIGFKRWSYSLTPTMVANEFNASNVNKMLGNYGADISVSTNGEVTNKFTIF
jgi:hypothetical protein